MELYTCAKINVIMCGYSKKILQNQEIIMNDSKTLSNEISRKISFFMLGFIGVIVLFHSDFRYYFPFIEDLSVVATSYFFCVSGFFFYKGLDNKNFIIRLRKRCITLLLPYLLWNLIYMILHISISDYTFSNVIYGFTVNPFCIPSWYLLTLFIFLVPSLLIKHALKNKYTTVIVLLCGMIISYLGYNRFQCEFAAIPVIGGYLARMSMYFISFLFGGIIGTWFSQNISVNWKKSVFGIISSCVIILILQYDILVEMRWLLWAVLSLMLWESIPEKIFRPSRIVNVLMRPAFFINMSHCYFLFLWGTIITKIDFITNKVSLVLTVILTVFSCYAVYYLLEFFMPILLCYLTGKRSILK